MNEREFVTTGENWADRVRAWRNGGGGDQPRRGSVMQEWTEYISFMQQSVLIAATRGPDGLHKNHISKVLLRWMRRSFLLSAFEGEAMLDPYTPGGGSFTGPCYLSSVDAAVEEYLKSVDEIPHHFQLHFLHAAQILGYKHPVEHIRDWWHQVYKKLVNDAHLFPESEELMDKRLGDNERDWRAREEVTADSYSYPTVAAVSDPIPQDNVTPSELNQLDELINQAKRYYHLPLAAFNQLKSTIAKLRAP